MKCNFLSFQLCTCYKMRDKLYLCLFIFCAILSHETVGTFLNENFGDSTNFLVREKRVINRLPGEDRALSPTENRYVVNIKKDNHVHCIGTILSPHTVITTAHCVILNEIRAYLVFSGSVYSSKGVTHIITGKKVHGNHPSEENRAITTIALITVSPTFVYSKYTTNINLHTEPVLPGMHGTISGWGSYCYGGQLETKYRFRLREITVPIMNHRNCVNSYRSHFEITDSHICTYDVHKQCGYTDAGAPLVIDNALAGVYLGRIATAGGNGEVKPDVFVFIQSLQYSRWIQENIVH